uniref:ATP-binding protein n=1 Tax=Desulfonatronovibrio magnus TaxID=698827 RepID=UPI0005EAF7E5
MNRYFNIAGPCVPDEHYMIPTEQRCKGLDILIEQEQYFVIHAARQSGKTTLLNELASQLNAQGRYYALYCSLESVQNIGEPEIGIPAITNAIDSAIRYNSFLSIKEFLLPKISGRFNVELKESLIEYCMKLDKPLIILFDEVDCLANGTL